MPIPSVTLSNPQDPFIGDSFDLTLSFDNTGDATGFGPFAVLFLDTTGADGTGVEIDDGLTFANATFLGNPITTTTITLEDTDPQTITVHGASTTINVPSDFEAGDTLVVFELPFGSFVDTQPVAEIDITLDSSDLADLGTDLHIEAQGGFIFGDTELGSTPLIQTGTSATAVQPRLVTIEKNYLGPEDETATGPNFVQQYEIVVNVAEGQTITGLDVTDYFPDTLQFVDVASIEFADSGVGGVNEGIVVTSVDTPDDGGLTSIGSTNITENDVGSDNIPTPGGNIIRRFDSITGTSGDRDIVITVDFFVPRLDANGDVIINATTGDDIFDQNQAELGGQGGTNLFDPNDSRDSDVTVSIAPTVNDDIADPADPDDTTPGVEGQTDTGLTGFGSDSDAGDEFNDPDHVLEEQSIAIQKDVSNATSAGAPFAPGTILEYTLDFQISDFFAFEDVFVTDTFSDGQRFYNPAGFEPTLTFTEHNNPAISGAQFTTSAVHTPSVGSTNPTVIDFLTIDETEIDGVADGNGDTTLTFDLSGLIAAQTGHDGQLVGGGVPDGGFSGSGLSLNNNPPLNTTFGGTTGTITFFTQVLEEFSDEFPSGDPSVDSGDILTNTAIIDGRVLDVDTLLPQSPDQREDDDTQAQLSIGSGQLFKSIFAINGVVDAGAASDTDASDGVDGFTSGVDVSPGDEVTYRLTFDLPVSDVENFTLEDFLPIPIYDVSELLGATAASLNSSTPDNSVPTVGSIEFGSLHTFPKLVQTTEDLTSEVDDGSTDDGIYIDTASNSFLLDFGDFDEVDATPSVVDILFTVTTQNDPFVDGLLFTNQVQQAQQSTFNERIEQEAIIQINLREPVLDIRKGVVAFSSDNTGFTFSSTDITFDGDPDSDPVIPEAPSELTIATGQTNVFSGTVSSTDINDVIVDPADPGADPATLDTTANLLNSDLSGDLEAGDLVTFAIVVENSGGSTDGAFDIVIQDTLPTGFQIPDGMNQLDQMGLNLQVTDGTGTSLGFTGLDSDGDATDDIFGSGIELIDGVSTGALAVQSDTSGENLAIITFDLEVTDDAPFLGLSSLVNTATISSYTNVEGGTNFVGNVDTEGNSDTASAGVANPTVTKSIVATSEAHTDEDDPREVAIGEIVRYRLIASLPEGVSTNLILRDNLPDGLTFLNDGTARVGFVSDSSGISSDSGSVTGNDIVGDETDLSTIASAAITGTLGDASISDNDTTNSDTYVSGGDVYFKLGNVTNSERDTNDEFVIVEFNALVDNDTIDENDDGDTRGNTATFLAENTSGTLIELATSTAATLEIVEPAISDVAKTVNRTVGTEGNPLDAGDTLTYTITFSNTGNADAFEVNLSDTLPDELDNLSNITTTIFDDATPTANDVTSSFTITPTSTSSTNGVTDDSDASAADNFDILIDQLPVGYSVQVTYTADVVGDIAPDTVFDNDATVTYTSLPGTGTPTGTGGNDTGSTTPGGTGASNGERDGSGNGNDPVGVNDFFDTNDTPATVTIDSVDAVKSIVATSETHTIEDGDGTTNDNDSMTGRRRVTIGEIVRYRLAIEVPEGEITDLIIQENLPDGHTFLNDGTAQVAFVSSTGDGTDATGLSSSLGSVGTTPGTGNFGTTASDADTFVALGDTEVSASSTIDDDTFGTGTDVFFKLGDVTNSDNDSDTEFVVIEFNALIDNNNDSSNSRNNRGNNITNNFEVLSGSTSLATSNDIFTRIVEPVITPTKRVEGGVTTSGTPFAADDDDSITFSVEFSNGSNPNLDSTAFEAVLIDTLPAELDLVSIDSISFDDNNGSTGTVNDPGATVSAGVITIDNVSDLAGGNQVRLNVDQIPLGATITVTYTANIVGDIAPEELIENTASVEYTSLPGDFGTTSNPTGSSVTGAGGSETGERNGDDGENTNPNDFFATSSGFVQVPSVDPVKSIVATSESHTGTAAGASATDEDVAIGEIVRYRLVTQIPESTGDNYQITDLLPDGLLYLAGSANVAFISTNGQTGGLTSSIITDAGVHSIDPNFTPTVAITAVNSDNPGNSFSSGDNPRFDLGTLTNTDNDSGAEFVVIEFNALVENIAANQDPGTLANQFQVSFDNAEATTITQTSESVSIDIVEPTISDVSKTVNTNTADAGNTLTYTITFSNTGNADAFDVNLADVLPDELDNLGSITTTIFDGAIGADPAPSDVTSSFTITPTSASSTNGVTDDSDVLEEEFNILIDQLPVGHSVQVTYTADVVGDIAPDTVFNNDATVTYSSLPENGTPTGTGGNDTGSTTPGGTGDANGDRNGSGGVNNFSDTSDAVSVTIDPLDPFKRIVATSEAHTSDDDVAIGEIVRYRLEVAIPEGVTENFQITDALPDGLLYLEGSTTNIGFISNGTGISSSNSAINNITDIGLTGDAVVSPDSDAVLISGAITSEFGGDNTFISGEDIIFSLGDITNADSDSDDEFVVIEFNALVENISSNQAATDVLPNQFTVSGDNVTSRTSTPPVTLDIVEPDISSVTKEADRDNADAGDTVTYTVTFTNTGADAFDLEILDTLPSGLDNLIVTSVVINDNSDPVMNVTGSFNVNDTSTNSTNNLIDDGDATDVVNITIDRLNTDHSVTITYTATVVSDVTLGSTVGNTVDVNYSSLPGTGTTSNATGSNTPGTSGAANGDRNGSGGVNDHTVSASDSVLINSFSIGSTVFADTDNDGFQDVGESGIDGVTVSLISGGTDGLISTPGDNFTVETVTTASGGNYFFDELPPGEYQVIIPVSNFAEGTGALASTTVSSFVTDTNDNGEDGDDNGIQTLGATQVESPIITLSAGAEPTASSPNPEDQSGSTQDDGVQDANGDLTVDFGFVAQASLGDTVFLDDNGNGIQDGSETGVDGITVTLVSGGADNDIDTTMDNVTIGTTTTAGGGLYSFDDLIPGVEYQVSFSNLPSNHIFTTQDATGSTDANDSDVDSSGIAPTVILTPGENNDTIDAGIFELASISNLVFSDDNGNGIQDGGELGVDGVDVILTSGGADGVIGTGSDDTTTTVTTSGGGLYSFDNLIPGVEYQVTFDETTLPDDHRFTYQDIGSDDAVDSDAGPSNGETGVIVLTSGEDNDSIDAGITEVFSIGSTVFADTDNDGFQDTGGASPESGIEGVTVNLIGAGADGIFEDDLGTVGIDESADNVSLTTTTDIDGNYFFTDLVTGDYQVVIPVSNFASGTGALEDTPLSSTTTDTADNGEDGDDNGIQTGGIGTEVTSPIINLTSGNEPTTTETGQGEAQDDASNLLDGNGDLTVDFGFVEPASLGNTVFFDNDRDGIQSGSELGVTGVTVSLVSGGDDGLISTTGDNPAPVTTTTDANGEYSFTGLTPGVEYQVTFDPATIPTEASFTTQDAAGSTEANDSDADTSTGTTAIVTLSPGEENLDIDAGVINNLIAGTPNSETLPGTDDDDLIIGGKGGDTLTGGLGADFFFYNETSESLDLITDFTVGEDKLDISQILITEFLESTGASYSGSDPIADDHLVLTELNHPNLGQSTLVQIDFDDVGPLLPKSFVILQGVHSDLNDPDLSLTDFII